MANTDAFQTTPTKTPASERPPAASSNSKKHHHRHHHEVPSASEMRNRFEAYNRLQAAAVAFGEKLPIPEIVAIGGQSDGKSSLLEALLGFRFNIREVEMGTRRPLILQMVHDPTSLEPRCRFQEEDSEDYGSPIISPSVIADTIKSRTEVLLKRTKSAVSSKPIVMRAEYAHFLFCAKNDGKILQMQAKKGEPDNTPDDILSMVKSLASPPHRILLFLQQSSVEWCSSLWLDVLREIDPTFRRTVIVVSKFDNRLKEFSDRWEVDRYLSASGYLGENTRPYFVALPKDRSAVSNDEFRRQISQVDAEILRYLRDSVKGGFDEEKYRSYIGFGSLRDYLETELQRRYKEATPATLALLEQRCSEVTADLSRMDSKIQATSDVAHLRRSSLLHAAALCNHVGALIEGAADPAPEQWGRTTEEERSESGIGSWPGVSTDIRPPNATLRLYGGAAFERVMHEFRCATYSIACPTISREKVANILLAHAGRGGSRGVTDAAAEIARAAARSWLSPLLDTACDRISFVLGNLFELAIERNLRCDSHYGHRDGDVDGYVGFLASLRQSYNRFIKDLSRQCKQLLRHHLDSVTSPYSQVCYEDFLGTFGAGSNTIYNLNQASAGSFCLELSDGGPSLRSEVIPKDQENVPPEKNGQETTPGKIGEARDALRIAIAVVQMPSCSVNCLRVGHLVEIVEAARDVVRGKRVRIMNIKTNMSLTINTLSASDHRHRSSSSHKSFSLVSAIFYNIVRKVPVSDNKQLANTSSFKQPRHAVDRLPVRRQVFVLGFQLSTFSFHLYVDFAIVMNAALVLAWERTRLQKKKEKLPELLLEDGSLAATQ
nr:dynamin-related protein 5A-like [Ipomoea batatas]